MCLLYAAGPSPTGLILTVASDTTVPLVTVTHTPMRLTHGSLRVPSSVPRCRALLCVHTIAVLSDYTNIAISCDLTIFSN